MTQAGSLEDTRTVYVWDSARESAESLVPLFDVTTGVDTVFDRAYVNRVWRPADNQHALAIYNEWRTGKSHRIAQELDAQRERQEQEPLLEAQYRAEVQRRAATLRRGANAGREAAKSERYRRKFSSSAVFSRNHPPYLKQALSIGADDPSQLITFRSRQRWVSAAQSVKWAGARPIYFATIGKDMRLTHRAWLQHVVLRPRLADPETEWALSYSLRGHDGTYAEKLWSAKNRVLTLYLISGCERFPRRRFATSLLKLSDNHRLSADYRYSYSLVRELE